MLSVCFVLKAMAVVPTALLYRTCGSAVIGDGRDRQHLRGGACAILAAANGAGYWSLVVQTVTMDALYLARWCAEPGRPA